MFWNWYTLDACFLSSTWHITSRGMFAGACIGVVSLVLVLEFLRRLQREYDGHILYRSQQRAMNNAKAESTSSSTSKADGNGHGSASYNDPPNSAGPLLGDWERTVSLRRAGYLPSVSQQAIRAGIYMLQAAVSYMIMLLAMYYNGYVLICIFIGAFIGSFMFSWDTFGTASASVFY